jgi:hypothetical protein
MTGIRAVLVFIVIFSSLPSTAVRADAGHDHGSPAATGIVGNAVPRIEAQSDLFEIVGVVEGGAMKIFLDRYATNEPVLDAKIEIDGGALKGSAQASPDGTYAFRHDALTRPGQFPITFTIVAGADTDLLAGDIVIPDPSAAIAGTGDDPWRKRWWWVGSGILLLAGLAIAWRMRRQRSGGIAP